MGEMDEFDDWTLPIAVSWFKAISCFSYWFIVLAFFILAIAQDNVPSACCMLLGICGQIIFSVNGGWGKFTLVVPKKVREARRQRRALSLKTRRFALSEKRRDKAATEAYVLAQELEKLGPEEEYWPKLDMSPQEKKHEDSNQVAEVDWADDGAVPV